MHLITKYSDKVTIMTVWKDFGADFSNKKRKVFLVATNTAFNDFTCRGLIIWNEKTERSQSNKETVMWQFRQCDMRSVTVSLREWVTGHDQMVWKYVSIVFFVQCMQFFYFGFAMSCNLPNTELDVILMCLKEFIYGGLSNGGLLYHYACHWWLTKLHSK